MTAKQKANRERFKKVVAEAKKLRKKNPKLTQVQAVKQAWAISYTKKRTKKSVGVAKKRKTATGERHKDTNSHNVKISVMSGIHKFSKDEKHFLETEGKHSKGYVYRCKLLWGDWIILKETKNGTPVKKWTIDSYEIGCELANQLNKGQKLTKVKKGKI